MNVSREVSLAVLRYYLGTEGMLLLDGLGEVGFFSVTPLWERDPKHRITLHRKDLEEGAGAPTVISRELVIARFRPGNHYCGVSWKAMKGEDYSSFRVVVDSHYTRPTIVEGMAATTARQAVGNTKDNPELLPLVEALNKAVDELLLQKEEE